MVVWGVDALEYFRIDDPIGAAPVHMLAGIFGRLSLGLFATGAYGHRRRHRHGGDRAVLGRRWEPTDPTGFWAEAPLAEFNSTEIVVSGVLLPYVQHG